MKEWNATLLSPVCLKVPPWYPRAHLVEFPTKILLIQMLVVYCLTQAIHHSSFKRFGLPPLASQLMAGVVLTPEICTTHIKPLKEAHEFIFPLASVVSLTVAAWYGGFIRVVSDQKQLSELSASASVLALSTFPVIAVLLSDLKLINSELGRLALSCGIVGEIAGIAHTLALKRILNTVDLLQKEKTHEVLLYVGRRVIGLSVFVLIVVFMLRPWMKKIIKKTPKGKPVKDTYLIPIFLLMLLGGLVTNISGEFVIIGCWVVGAAVPDGPPLGSAIVGKFDTFVSGILQPFFITMSTMRANVFKVNFHDKVIHGVILVTLSGFATKIVICLACGLYYRMEISDALALAAIMSSKGIVEIGIFNMFIDSKLIRISTCAILMVVTIIVAIVVPIIVKCLYQPLRKYAGYQNRDIVSCNLEAHLRILTCISKPDDVPAFIHLLTLSNQATNNVIVDVLHLIKLVGRAQPIFMSHDLQEGNSSENMSYSEDMISAFNSLIQRANMEDLFIHFFTAVTPPKAMHDDICTLALNNLASLIILPFHRKLSTLDGAVDFEDYGQRTLNNSMLERAPCSVGIFINKGTLKLPTVDSLNMTSVVVQSQSEQNQFSAAVIFIGGADDQEAVAYAKRMASGPKVWVLVIRLVTSEGETELSELDSTTISDIQQYKEIKQQFNYSEQVVHDGSQTAKMLRSIAEDFDLIIVGRSHNPESPQLSGLQQWSEVQELGILGDILAAPDFPGKTSILVLQRQKQWLSKGYK
uniref:Cation/H+ exchanger domain-containing protein n=1 Tax=Chenopodium quinoa TaxID=63459 RepID=A0A803KS57_CHEQI